MTSGGSSPRTQQDSGLSPTRGLLKQAAQRLSVAGVASPDHDAAALLAHVLGASRVTVTTADFPTEAERSVFDELVERRARREPLQHLTGTAAFRYVELAVGRGVFVPRPETELLAGWGIEAAREVLASGRRPVVVDLCTGSGAVALALSDELTSADIHAVELSEDAYPWAVRNLAGSGVDLHQGDMADALGHLDGCVDVVVANPPYIPLEAFESVAPEAREFDPAVALWSGQDGLDATRVLERAAARLLRQGGVVGAEHADLQGVSAPAVFTATGRWRDVRDNRDLAGRPRFVTARLAR